MALSKLGWEAIFGNNGHWNLLKVDRRFIRNSDDWLRMSMLRKIGYTPLAIYIFAAIDNTLGLEIMHGSCESNDLS